MMYTKYMFSYIKNSQKTEYIPWDKVKALLSKAEKAPYFDAVSLKSNHLKKKTLYFPDFVGTFGLF